MLVHIVPQLNKLLINPMIPTMYRKSVPRLHRVLSCTSSKGRIPDAKNAVSFELPLLEPFSKTSTLFTVMNYPKYVITKSDVSYEEYLAKGGMEIPKRRFISNLSDGDKFWALLELSNEYNSVCHFDHEMPTGVIFNGIHVIHSQDLEETISNGDFEFFT